MNESQDWATRLREWHARLFPRLIEAVGEEAAVAIEVTACLLVLLLFFWIRWQFGSGSRVGGAPLRRFKELARAHKLPHADRALLQAMAERLGLEEPSAIFVRRSLFETAGQKLAVDRLRLETLRQQLYS